MARRVTLKVEAPKDHPDVLAVQDAMQQVLDYFRLLTPEGKSAGEVVWRLTFATTSSPLTVVAEAVSLHTDVDVSLLAAAQIKSFARNLRDLRGGKIPHTWSQSKANVALSVVRRTFNGIGATEVAFDDEDEAPIRIDTSAAKESLAKLQEAPIHQFRAHSERGAVEGNLVEIMTYYNAPAILIREHGTAAEVICTINQETVDEINEAIRADDVWHRRRVSVHGMLHYDDKGKIIRVLSDSVALIPTPRDVTINELRDPDFTAGLDTIDYLERLREGELGG